jgi:hypothetical protein
MNDPMPIKNLPEYLNSVRDREQDYVPVVDMGRIESESNVFRKLSYVAILLLMVGVGATAYNLNSRNLTILINAKDTNIQTVSELLKDDGAKVISVEKKDDVYEAKISLRKNIKSFIENLRERKEIEKVELKN